MSEVSHKIISVPLSPKAARFAAYACETLAEQREAEGDWESDNDAALYRSIAKTFRDALQ